MPRDVVSGRAAEMEGYLYKQGGLGQESNRIKRRASQTLIRAGAISGTLYRRRWFRLFGTTLRYSAEPSSKELGFLDLAELSHISAPGLRKIAVAGEGDEDVEEVEDNDDDGEGGGLDMNSLTATSVAFAPPEPPAPPPSATAGREEKAMHLMELRFTGRTRVHRLCTPSGSDADAARAERWRQAMVNASFLADDSGLQHANPMMAAAGHRRGGGLSGGASSGLGPHLLVPPPVG